MKSMKLRSLVLSLLVGLLALAAACQSQQPPAPAEGEGQATAAPPSDEGAAPPAEEPAAPPPDKAAPSGGSKAPAQPSGGGSTANGHAAEPAPTAPPESSTTMVAVPEGKNIKITLNDAISSKTSKAGDTFTATVKADVQTRAHPAPIIPSGSTLTGTVVEVQKAKEFKGQAKLVVKFEELKLLSGKSIPITASLITEGKDTTKRSVGGIAGGAAAGAILGKIIGKDTKGAAIGAVAGAAIGTGVVLGLDNKDVELPAGTDLFLNVDTEIQVPVPAGA